MRKLYLFLLIVVLFSLASVSVLGRNALDSSGLMSRYESDRSSLAFLGGNNNFTGVNIFQNYTWINYQSFNVSGTMNVSEICIGSVCIDSWFDVNDTYWNVNDTRLDAKINSIGNWSADKAGYVPYVGATNDVSIGAYKLTASNVVVLNNLTVGDTTGQILFGNGGGYSWNSTDTCMVSPANSTGSRNIFCVTKPND